MGGGRKVRFSLENLRQGITEKRLTRVSTLVLREARQSPPFGISRVK